MSRRDARRALTWYKVIPTKGGNIRESIPGVSRFRTDDTKGECCVFSMLGLRIWIRLVILSNLHVQSIFIRVTDYFMSIFKVLIHFLIFLVLILVRN